MKGYAEIARRFGTRPLPGAGRAGGEAGARRRAGGPPLAPAAVGRPGLPAGGPGGRGDLPRGGEPPCPAPGSSRRTWPRPCSSLGRDPEAFYRGPLARRIAAAVRARGGVLTAADLAAYRTREREVLWGEFRGHRVAGFPPPSAGGAIVLGLLRALEGEDPRGRGPLLRALPARLRRGGEAALRAAREALLADPDFVPGADAVAREMASAAFAAADPGRASGSGRRRPAPRDRRAPPATPPTSRSWTRRGTRWRSPPR